MGIVHSRNTLTYPRIFFGNYWQLLATFGYFWQLFATIGNFGQYMSWDDMSRDKMSLNRTEEYHLIGWLEVNWMIPRYGLEIQFSISQIFLLKVAIFIQIPNGDTLY